MNVIIVSSALDSRNEPLARAFKEKGFATSSKWTGTKDWPDFSSDIAGVVFLEDGRLRVLESIIEARQKTRRYQGTPLIVVPNDWGPRVRVKYISAGATQVCSPDETKERIVAEIQARFDFDSREAEQARLELLQPFIAATIEAMEVMASVHIKINKVFRKRNYNMDGDISGVIYLISKTERLLAVTFPMATAKKISSKVLAGAVEDPTAEMVSDCVGEIVNVIAGQVKGRFVHTDYEFDISTPTLISGPSHEIHHKSSLPCYVMTFGGEVGNFSLQLCVRGKDGLNEEAKK